MKLTDSKMYIQITPIMKRYSTLLVKRETQILTIMGKNLKA